MRIIKETPLSIYTTFSIGGSADFLIEVSNLAELKEAYEFASSNKLPVFVLGGGSNTLVSDQGFRGLVIKINIGGIEEKLVADSSLVRAGAGVSWDDLVAWTVARNLWGLENLSGIPGTVGGAVVQNIGAYGAAVSEILENVEVFNTRTGEFRVFTPQDCLFDYRSSFFKNDGGENVVLSASFKLSFKPNPILSYTDLKVYFDGILPTLPNIRQAVLNIRKGKFPDLAVEGTAGSFFKNPILTKTSTEVLKLKYPQMPLFDMPETEGVKVPAGWILDKVLGLRGYILGKARLYEKQALVIVAERGALAKDVLFLEKEVKKLVREECGIELTREVVYLE